jgi:hypothetical protein
MKKQKKDVYCYSIGIPIFGGATPRKLLVWVPGKSQKLGQTIELAQKKCGTCFNFSDDVNAFGAVCLTAETCHVLAFGRSCLSIGVIVHEVVHFARSFLDDSIDIPLCAETDEVYAYFIEYFVNEICKLLKKDKLI